MSDLAERRGVETEVYEPAEDSWLLAETAADVIEPDWLVLEVGTGSGIVAEHVAEETTATVLASDINPHACERARERGIQAVRADFVSPFRDGAFDAVLFNPPYLPTPPEQEWDDWMEHALSGGEDGRKVIDPFLAVVERVLAPDGIVLLLVSSLTDIEAVSETAAEHGLLARERRDKSYPYERLVVLELSRR